MMIWKLFARPASVATLLAITACADQPQTYQPIAAGQPAPAFGAPDLEGDSVSLKSLRGEAVMLNVWATWCAPCREEMPHLQQLHEQYGSRGLRVVGVSVDPRGAERTIRDFLGDVGVTFMILHDPQDAISRAYRTIGVPETFLIDRDGVIRRRWIGKFDPLAEDVVRDVKAVLAESS